MSSVGRRNGAVTFRLHRIFRDAPVEILEALVRLHFVSNHRAERRRLIALVRHHVTQNAAAISPRVRVRRRRLTLQPHGIYVNLDAIFEEMNRRFFGERVQASITWSRSVNRRQMGSCREDSGKQVIVINRLLDNPQVPQYYLNFLVIHEMLHCVYPRRIVNGRIVRHPKEMREFERKLPFYRQAIAWEKRQVERLYRSYKQTTPAQQVFPFMR